MGKDKTTAGTTPTARSLQAVLDRLGLSQNAASKLTGVPQPTINRLLRGSDPKGGTIQKLQKGLGCNGDWQLISDLPYIAGTDSSIIPYDTDTSRKDDNLYSFHYHRVVKSPKKNKGRTHMLEKTSGIQYLTSQTLEFAGVKPQNVKVFILSDNSMTGEIESGSPVAVDTSITKIVNGETYAIRVNGALRAVRLRQDVSGDIHISCNNPDKSAYPDETIDAATMEDSAHYELLGWVFWWNTTRKRIA